MVISLVEAKYILLGVCVGLPVANSLQGLYDKVDRQGDLSWRWDLFTAATIPLTATTFAAVLGAVLGWRLDDAWVGGTWAAVGGVVSPYLWPSVLKSLRAKALAGISAVTASASRKKEPPDDPQPDPRQLARPDQGDLDP